MPQRRQVEHEGDPTTMVTLRRAATLLLPAAVVAVIVVVVVTRGSELGAALGAASPWVFGAAVGAHLLTLVLRTEAWRTVLHAAGGRRLTPGAVHAANAGAFLAGTVQGQAALPTRIALLRRLGGDDAPSVSQMALGDAPIVLLEVCGSAVLATIGSTAVGIVPFWTPWAMLAGALGVLVALRLLHARFACHRLAAGVGVLADRRLRTRLALIVAAFTAMAFLRTLVVMAGLGLPADPAHVCLVLFTMGAVGLLPLGVGTGPAAMVAALGGSTSLVTAAAAGLVVSAATVAAVVVYGGAVWVWQASRHAPAWPRIAGGRTVGAGLAELAELAAVNLDGERPVTVRPPELATG
jgi:hypothetical protein